MDQHQNTTYDWWLGTSRTSICYVLVLVYAGFASRDVYCVYQQSLSPIWPIRSLNQYLIRRQPFSAFSVLHILFWWSDSVGGCHHIISPLIMTINNYSRLSIIKSPLQSNLLYLGLLNWRPNSHLDSFWTPGCSILSPPCIRISP